MNDRMKELYQEMILEHNKNPKNFRVIENATHKADGHNPLCGDNLSVYLILNDDKTIEDISFEGSGCAISKSSASMMTQALKGKTEADARELFDKLHNLLTGKMKDQTDQKKLGKLAVFSGIWEYPSRVKCAVLSWHTMKSALDKIDTVSTE